MATGAGRSSRLVPDQLVMMHERVVRRPLGFWAEELRAELEAWSRQDPSTLGTRTALMRIANATALIEAHEGQNKGARKTCWATLHWLGSHAAAEAQNDSDASSLALQPWVNLGRLHSLEGRLEAALTHFGRLLPYLRDEMVRLGPVGIGGGHFRADTATCRRVTGIVRASYVLDSLKALLRAREYGRLLTFGKEVEAYRWSTVEVFLREAQLVAMARLGDETVLALASEYERESSSWERLVYRLRRAQALAAFGHVDRAADVAMSLAPVAIALCESARLNLTALLLAQQAAHLLEDIGHSEQASGISIAALSAARRLHDEPSEIELLRFLNASAPDSRASSLRSTQLAEITSRTGYVQFRAGSAVNSDASVETLVSLLHDTLSMKPSMANLQSPSQTDRHVSRGSA